MASTHASATSLRSHHASPVPHRQLSALHPNQRSYSRLSSKGYLGDDSPLLSPLPVFSRRRSVTFADDEGARVTRERAVGGTVVSAPSSPVPSRDRSPPPTSILKVQSSYNCDEENPPAAVSHQSAVATTYTKLAAGSPRTSPTPRRGRSLSRQRLAARRREAQLHHSFFDDSFVEDYVLKVKGELELEEEQRRQEERKRRDEEKVRLAQQRAADAEEKINALQHAKEILLAAAERRRPSVTPPPSRETVDSHRRLSAKQTVAGTEMLKSLEEDSDPEIQVALEELSRLSAANRRSKRATTASGGGNAVPRRGGRAAASSSRRSVPIVSEDTFATSDDGNENTEITFHDNHQAKLSRVVSKILAERSKNRKSKRSVVVIDWSDDDSLPATSSTDAEVDVEEIPVKPRGRSVKSRSVALTSALGTNMAKASIHRPAASQKRSRSAVPELGDSILFEADDDKPILLPRRQRRRLSTTRSISHIDTELDDQLLEDCDAEEIMHRPPRVQNTSKNRRRTNLKACSSSSSYAHPNANAPKGAASVRAASTARRCVPVARDDPTMDTARDPMAVFFDAAFPSPSKFDEMMQQAGGLPEARGTGRRGHMRQLNLVLPSSIGRRR